MPVPTNDVGDISVAIDLICMLSMKRDSEKSFCRQDMTPSHTRKTQIHKHFFFIQTYDKAYYLIESWKEILKRDRLLYCA